MDFPFLLQSIDNLWNLIRDSLDTFGLVKQGIDGFLVMAHLHLSLVQFVLAWIVNALEVEVIYFLLEDIGSLLEVHYLLLVQKLKLSMNVLHLLGHCVILLGCWFPVADHVVDELKSLHEVIEPDQDPDVFLRFIVHNIDVNLRVLNPFFLLFFLLAMGILHFLNHPAEFHHVDGSSCDLCRYHVVLVSFSDEVLLDDTQEL
jgi:hypothetical protein